MAFGMRWVARRIRPRVIGWVGAWFHQEIDPRFDWIHARIDRLEPRVWELGDALERVEPHVAALEVRFADVEFAALLRDPNLTEAQRTTLLQFQAEHQRISARLQAISHYEERLRRLEKAVADSES